MILKAVVRSSLKIEVAQAIDRAGCRVVWIPLEAEQEARIRQDPFHRELQSSLKAALAGSAGVESHQRADFRSARRTSIGTPGQARENRARTGFLF